MAREAALILETLDRHLKGPATIRLLGGGALTLAYGLERSTEDVDLLQDDAEIEAMLETADFGHALDDTNAELEPRGLYLTHIWGPEQLILADGWRERCREVSLANLLRLRVTALGPADLIISKLVRADDGDVADMAFLLRTHAGRDEVERLLEDVRIPDLFRDVWPQNVAVLRKLLAEVE